MRMPLPRRTLINRRRYCRADPRLSPVYVDLYGSGEACGVLLGGRDARALPARVHGSRGAAARARVPDPGTCPSADGYEGVSTIKEPYRLEGKKNMGYEIPPQLGWRMRDVTLYPADDKVGVIINYRATSVAGSRSSG